jgi:glutamyl-tRNA synthetase
MRISRSNRVLSGWICGSCEKKLHASQAQRRPNSTITRKARLPDTPARTRFAPSPTGDLHLGSLRTALFNYLLARRTKGEFLLRLEDTDQKRTVPGAEERLYEDLQWAGLQWDEGPLVGGPYGPYRQSERTRLYQEHVKPLLQSGKAYRCFCSSERIKSFHEARHTAGLPLGYDRKCAHIPPAEAEDRAHKGESHVIRFLVPKEYPKYHDLIYGPSGHGSNKTRSLLIDSPVYDDPILLKSDSHPTYHFANIIDDHLMKITHVIRGSEWLTSTPLHIALYQALNLTPPSYAHVPLLVSPSGAKLSKRETSTSLSHFRAQGTLPAALTNFTALLGWSHQGRSDVMDLFELSQTFDLKLTKGNTIVAFDKLNFLQDKHARRVISAEGEPLEQMIRDVADALLARYGAGKMLEFLGGRDLSDVVLSMIRSTHSGWKNAATFTEWAGIFLEEPPSPVMETDDFDVSPAIRTAALTLLFTPPERWTVGNLRAGLEGLDFHCGLEAGAHTPTFALGSMSPIVKANKLARGKLYHYLRWALLGGRAGPGIPETMEILGRESCVRRIQAAEMLMREVVGKDGGERVERVEKRRGDEGENEVLRKWTASRLFPSK